MDSMAYHAVTENGSAASELRCRCAWLHHGSGPRIHRIQGCGAIDPRPQAGSPLIVITRTAPSGPSCRSCQGKAWQGRSMLRVGATANLDSSCARRRERSADRDEETGRSDRTKKLTKKNAAPCQISLTKKVPYKESRHCCSYIQRRGG